MKIKVDHIPYSTPNKRRQGLKQTPKHITIHSTGNPSSVATGERGWLTNPSNNRQASWHYVVDSSGVVIEAIPPNEVAWHSGDGNGQGNRASISIEICESGDRAKAYKYAIELTAYLMKKHNITSLKRHYDWSRKNCPRIMNNNGDWSKWYWFKSECQKASKGAGTSSSIQSAPTPSKKSHSPSGVPSQVLQYGNKGNAVKQLQIALNSIYFKCGTPDGSYGAQTRDAVKRFQSMYCPPIDGIFGPNTRNALLKQMKK